MMARLTRRRPRALAAALLVDSSWRLEPLARRLPIAILVPTLLLLIARLGREALGRGSARRAGTRAPSPIVEAGDRLAALVGGILLSAPSVSAAS